MFLHKLLLSLGMLAKGIGLCGGDSSPLQGRQRLDRLWDAASGQLLKRGLNLVERFIAARSAAPILWACGRFLRSLQVGLKPLHRLGTSLVVSTSVVILAVLFHSSLGHLDNRKIKQLSTAAGLGHAQNAVAGRSLQEIG